MRKNATQPFASRQALTFEHTWSVYDKSSTQLLHRRIVASLRIQGILVPHPRGQKVHLADWGIPKQKRLVHVHILVLDHGRGVKVRLGERSATNVQTDHLTERPEQLTQFSSSPESAQGTPRSTPVVGSTCDCMSIVVAGSDVGIR